MMKLKATFILVSALLTIADTYSSKIVLSYDKHAVEQCTLSKFFSNLSSQDLYNIFTNNSSKSFQSTIEVAKYTPPELQDHSILNIAKGINEKFKEDFLKIANTRSGKNLIVRILVSIFTKSERFKEHKVFQPPLAITIRACKCLKVIAGETNKEYEWEDPIRPKIIEGTLRYTPRSEVKLCVINEKNELLFEECPSDVALFHELLHWLHGLEDFSSYTKNKLVNFKNIQQYEQGIGIDKFTKSHALLSVYFPEYSKNVDTQIIMRDMWCNEENRAGSSLKVDDFFINLEEMRTVLDYEDISENIYRHEIKQNLRLCYNVFFENDENTKKSIQKYLQDSNYYEILLKKIDSFFRLPINDKSGILEVMFVDGEE